MEISLNLADFTDFLKIQMLYHFMFILFKKCFLTHSCNLKHALFKASKS